MLHTWYGPLLWFFPDAVCHFLSWTAFIRIDFCMWKSSQEKQNSYGFGKTQEWEYFFNQVDAASRWTKLNSGHTTADLVNPSALTKNSPHLPLWFSMTPNICPQESRPERETSWSCGGSPRIQGRKVEETCCLGFPESQQGELCWGGAVNWFQLCKVEEMPFLMLWSFVWIKHLIPLFWLKF